MLMRGIVVPVSIRILLVLTFAGLLSSCMSAKKPRERRVDEFKGLKIAYLDAEDAIGKNQDLLFSSWGNDEVPEWLSNLSPIQKRNPEFYLYSSFTLAQKEDQMNVCFHSNRAEIAAKLSESLITGVKTSFDKYFASKNLATAENSERINSAINTLSQTVTSGLESYDSGYIQVEEEDAGGIVYKCYTLMGLPMAQYKALIEDSLKKSKGATPDDAEFIKRATEELNERYQKGQLLQ